jgi:hypothetical protein
MNDKTSQGNSTDRDDETVERLLRLAGPRAAIPDEIEARVYDRVHQEWRASSQPPDGARVYQFVRREWEKDTTRRRYRRWALPVTIAASVAAAAAAVGAGQGSDRHCRESGRRYGIRGIARHR